MGTYLTWSASALSLAKCNTRVISVAYDSLSVIGSTDESSFEPDDQCQNTKFGQKRRWKGLAFDRLGGGHVLVIANSSTSSRSTESACFVSASKPASVNLLSLMRSSPLVISSATSCIAIVHSRDLGRKSPKTDSNQVMSSNTALRNLLKDARTHIADKKYEDLLKCCQEILRLDKKNYNAFCFVGLAHSKLGNTEKSQQAYIQATKLQPDQLLAWQVRIWSFLVFQSVPHHQLYLGLLITLDLLFTPIYFRFCFVSVVVPSFSPFLD